jgi:hypothetical protein
VERVGRLSQALKLCKSDHKKAADKLRVRRSDHKDITTELESFDGLDDAVGLAVEVETLLGEVGAVAAEVVALGALLSRYTARAQEVSDLAGIESVDVPGPESITEARSLAVEIESLAALIGRWVEASGQVTSLAGIESVDVPSAEAIEEAQGLAVEIEALTTLGNRWTEAQGSVDSLTGITDVAVPNSQAVEEATQVGADLAALVVLEGRQKGAQAAVEKWEGAMDVAKGLSLDGDDPRLTQASKLQKGLVVLSDLQDRLEKRRGEVDTLAGQLALAEEAEAEANTALVVVLGDTEQCPTCHTPMDETHLHGEVA